MAHCFSLAYIFNHFTYFRYVRRSTPTTVAGLSVASRSFQTRRSGPAGLCHGGSTVGAVLRTGHKRTRLSTSALGDPPRLLRLPRLCRTPIGVIRCRSSLRSARTALENAILTAVSTVALTPLSTAVFTVVLTVALTPVSTVVPTGVSTTVSTVIILGKTTDRQGTG